MQSDPAAFRSMLDGFSAAFAAYKKLGASITDKNHDGKITTTDAPSGLDMTDIAQKAAVSAVVAGMATLAAAAAEGSQTAGDTMLYNAIFQTGSVDTSSLDLSAVELTLTTFGGAKNDMINILATSSLSQVGLGG